MRHRLQWMVLLLVAGSGCADRPAEQPAADSTVVRLVAVDSAVAPAQPPLSLPVADSSPVTYGQDDGVHPATLPPNLLSACDSAKGLVHVALDLQVAREDGEFNDSPRGTRRLGCRLRAEGSFTALKNAAGPVAAVEKAFGDRGWRDDIRFMADGPDGSDVGLRKLDLLCLVGGHWDGGVDDESADASASAAADPRYQIVVECARDLASNQNAGVPDSIWRIASEAGLDSVYAISGSLQYPPYIDGDFDGDGLRDAAVLVEHRATGKLGLAIVSRATRKVTVLAAGAGGAGPEDLSWIDRWETFRKGTTYHLTIQDRPSLPLQGDALWVGRGDSLSAFYFWTGASYVWEPHRLPKLP